VFRGDRAKDAELLVLRHENAALRRQASRVRYEPADRPWFAALAPFIPWRQRARIFPVTPATLLAWQRRLVARKYDTSTRRRAGRPPAVRSIARIAVRLARENPLRGYRRTQKGVAGPSRRAGRSPAHGGTKKAPETSRQHSRQRAS
jgi:putative transposase